MIVWHIVRVGDLREINVMKSPHDGKFDFSWLGYHYSLI